MKYFLEVFTEGLNAYQKRCWDEGIVYIEDVVQQIPNDSVFHTINFTKSLRLTLLE
jgi:hypothetical protein